MAGLRASLVLLKQHRASTTALEDLRIVLGNRPAAVARELTKMFEEVRRGSLQELLDHYTEAGPPKGEIVIVVGPPLAENPEAAIDLDAALLKALVVMRVKEAAEAVAAATNLPKRQVYQRALELKQQAPGDADNDD